jgi:hypothetical protein
MQLGGVCKGSLVPNTGRTGVVGEFILPGSKSPRIGGFRGLFNRPSNRKPNRKNGMPLDRTLHSQTNPLLFFPLRHHSPAAAKLLRQLILDRPPAHILIEGPSDFNDRISELFLPHTLPIAIYSYIQTDEADRRGAFYPFCAYSPEWVALSTAHQLNIPVRFIDQPYGDRSPNHINNCYSDESLTRGSYIQSLCEKLGVEGFDALWDSLFEIDPEITLDDYLERCHQFCWHLRQSGEVQAADRDREAYMAHQIRQVQRETAGQILIVTGGFHSSALFELLQADDIPKPQQTPAPATRGIALTPYSYQRLDNLTGYNSGMPNPGFYHTVWESRQNGQQAIAPKILTQVITKLREQKQIASTADLIAVQTLAQGLADLRSHAEIWRSDLIDGVIGGLVKEDLGQFGQHPFLEAIHDVLRGQKAGQLADGTPLPPFVQDLHRRLRSLDLFPTMHPRKINLDLLENPSHSQSSALLHGIRILEIHGIHRTEGTDFVVRSDLSKIWERWQIQWSPEFDASCIETAIYGTTLPEATIAKLRERAYKIDRDSEQAALLLLDAALAGVLEFVDSFYPRLIQLLRQESNFLTLSKSLQHLLYLYRYDEVLNSQKQTTIAQILTEAFNRGLWLLNSLGVPQGEEALFVQGIANLLETYERSSPLLSHKRSHLVQTLDRFSQDQQQLPILRGAAIGALWILGETPMDQIVQILTYYGDPEQLGDFLTGLFQLARETTQRDSDLLLSIDDLLLNFSDDDFLTALPALRLAFSFFTPREKHKLATTLIQSTEGPDISSQEFLHLPMGLEVAAQAIAFESKLFALVNQYGLRGGTP